MTALKSRNTHWTPEEVTRLSWDWGTVGLSKLVKLFGRTRIAIIRKAASLKLGGLKRGKKSIKTIAEETGYASSTIRIVMKNLNMNLHRVDRGDRKYATKGLRHYMVGADQEEAIIAYLKANGYRSRQLRNDSKKSPRDLWGTGVKPPQCHGCRRKDKKHYALGRCRHCYNKVRRAKKKNVDSSVVQELQ